MTNWTEQDQKDLEGRMQIRWPLVKAATDLSQVLYETHLTGGKLHIVLDDGNFHRANHIEWCIANAREAGDHLCVAIGELLIEMTPYELQAFANDEGQEDEKYHKDTFEICKHGEVVNSYENGMKIADGVDFCARCCGVDNG